MVLGLCQNPGIQQWDYLWVSNAINYAELKLPISCFDRSLTGK